MGGPRGGERRLDEPDGQRVPRRRRPGPGARKFIRGLADIPAAVDAGVDPAYNRADREEGRRQQEREEKELPSTDTANVVEQLEATFAELRAKGLEIQLLDLGVGERPS